MPTVLVSITVPNSREQSVFPIKYFENKINGKAKKINFYYSNLNRKLWAVLYGVFNH